MKALWNLQTQLNSLRKPLLHSFHGPFCALGRVAEPTPFLSFPHGGKGNNALDIAGYSPSFTGPDGRSNPLPCSKRGRGALLGAWDGIVAAAASVALSP